MQDLRVPRWAKVSTLTVSAAVLYALASPFDRTFLSDDWVLYAQVRTRGLGDVLTSTLGDGAFYRPVLMASLWVDTRLFGTSPVGPHNVNFFLHVINTLLVGVFGVWLLSALGSSGQTGPASNLPYIATLLFLFHPSHSEPVAWVAARGDLWVTFFGLMTLMAFIRYLDTRRTPFLIAGTVSMALALLSKEAGLSLVFMAIVLIAVRAVDRHRRVRVLGAVTSVLIFYLMLRSWMLGTPMGGYPAQWHVSPVRLVGRAAQLVFRSFFPPIPVDVSGVYGAGLKPTPALIALGLIGAGVGLLGLLWVGRSVRRWRPEDRRAVIGLGGMWLTAFIPVANLSINITDGQGDRFVYWPSVFSCLLAALLIERLCRRSTLLFGVVVGIVGGSVYAFHQTLTHWKTAARMTALILEGAADCPVDTYCLIVNLPDHVGGAYVFRNGFREALERQAEHRSLPVDYVAKEAMRAAGPGRLVALRPGWVWTPGGGGVLTAAHPGNACLGIDKFSEKYIIFHINSRCPARRVRLLQVTPDRLTTGAEIPVRP